MAVAGCVFNLNRGNFSPITKFIGTVVRARIRTHRDGRPRFKHRDHAPNVDSLSPCATHDEGGNSRVDSKSVQEKHGCVQGNVLFREEHENRGYCNGRFDLRFRGLSSGRIIGSEPRGHGRASCPDLKSSFVSSRDFLQRDTDKNCARRRATINHRN